MQFKSSAGKSFLIFFGLLFITSASQAAIVLVDDQFNGLNSTFLNAQSPTVNTINGATWQSNTALTTTFRADGVVNGTTSNVDVGAWLDLGGSVLAANSTYTLTLGQSNLTNGVFYFGLSDDPAIDVAVRAQNQAPLSVGLRVRNIPATGVHISAYKSTGGNNTTGGVETESVIASDLSYLSGQTYTATIVTNSDLTSATISVGNASVSFNPSSLNKLFVAFEDNGTSTGTIDFINFTNTTVPEPGTWALLALGGLGLIATKKIRR